MIVNKRQISCHQIGPSGLVRKKKICKHCGLQVSCTDQVEPKQEFFWTRWQIQIGRGTRGRDILNPILPHVRGGPSICDFLLYLLTPFLFGENFLFFLSAFILSNSPAYSQGGSWHFHCILLLLNLNWTWKFEKFQVALKMGAVFRLYQDTDKQNVGSLHEYGMFERGCIMWWYLQHQKWVY